MLKKRNLQLKTKYEMFAEFIVITLIVSLLFTLNSMYIVMFISGALLSYLLCKSEFRLHISIIVATTVAYLLGTQISLTGAFLLGVNAFGFYLYIRSKNTEIINALILLNTIVLASTVFPLALENLRGFNKIKAQDISLAIPIITILPLLLHVFMSIMLESVKSLTRYKTQFMLSISTLLTTAYFILGYDKFKEIGTDKIYIPLLTGIIVFLVNLFFKKKYAIVAMFITIFMVVILPYQVSGILGVTLAFLISYIATVLFQLNTSTLSGLIPFIFLLTAVQIREDRGFITEFNINTGYQLGYLFLSMIIIATLPAVIKTIKHTFIENEIEKLIPLASTIFTIGLFPIIMKFGKYEALSGLIFATSLLVLSLQLFTAVGITNVKILKNHVNDLLSIGLLFSVFSYFTLVLY